MFHGNMKIQHPSKMQLMCEVLAFMLAVWVEKLEESVPVNQKTRKEKHKRETRQKDLKAISRS